MLIIFENVLLRKKSAEILLNRSSPPQGKRGRSSASAIFYLGQCFTLIKAALKNCTYPFHMHILYFYYNFNLTHSLTVQSMEISSKSELGGKCYIESDGVG